VSVEDKFTVVLPQFQIPLAIRAAPGRSAQVMMTGDSGRIKATNATKSPVVRAFSSENGSVITIGNRARSREVPFHGDLFRYPRRRIVVDATSPEAEEPRMLIASWGDRSTPPGESLEMRIQYLDSLDHSTITPVQVAAYCYDRGMLNPDGTLGESAASIRPPSATQGFVDEHPGPKGRWTSLRIAPAREADVFRIQIPDLPDNVYKLRVVVERRGGASPESALGMEFAHAVAGGAAGGTLSLFMPAARHVFRPGEPLEIHVAAKSEAGFQGGRLTVDLVNGGERFNLVSQDAGAVDGRRYTWSSVLPGGVTSLLRPGRYEMVARIGSVESNHYEFVLVEPRYERRFHYYNHTWGAPSLDVTSQRYANTPPGVEAANLKRRDLETNCRVNARLYDVVLEEWSVFRNFDLYGGRDDSSEIARIEQMLKENLSLPAHEAYYYQNHFEVMNETMARYGLGHMNDLLAGFSPRSLLHSVKKDFEAKMRQYQLTAQAARRFPNFTGWSLVKDDTNPIGDSEVGDKNRSVRLYWQRRNFVEKYIVKPLAFMEGRLYVPAAAARGSGGYSIFGPVARK
jgi:hypothetical protein